MDVGPWEIGLILVAVMLLFGYKKLPDASRAIGRSLRIFKGELKGMKGDEAGRPAGPTPPVPGEVLPPDAFTEMARLEAEACAAEARAAQLRARAERARTSSADPVR